jgi:hypothetical protein
MKPTHELLRSELRLTLEAAESSLEKYPSEVAKAASFCD